MGDTLCCFATRIKVHLASRCEDFMPSMHKVMYDMQLSEPLSRVIGNAISNI